MYRIQEFAKLAGVTVRTLHHYDRVGLLSPRSRSQSGYRIYGHPDLGRLERILVLRFLGLPLREIAELLDSRGDDAEATLADTLARQAHVLRERRAGIDHVLRAITRALQQASTTEQSETPDWQIYQSILKEMQMQDDQNWAEKYYSQDAKEAVEQRKGAWTPELQAKITADWQQMYADVQNALDRGIEPKSEQGQELATRWMALVGQFTGGDPGVLEGLNRLYSDRENWPKAAMKPEKMANMPKPEHMNFIRAAQANA